MHVRGGRMPLTDLMMPRGGVWVVVVRPEVENVAKVCQRDCATGAVILLVEDCEVVNAGAFCLPEFSEALGQVVPSSEGSSG